MADCDLCGVSRPTLCPVKVKDPGVEAAYPAGTWRGLNEECLNSCHEAYVNKIPANAEKCDLCGVKKNMPVFQAKIHVPVFEEPYRREVNKVICGSCLEACEEALKRREEGEAHH